MPEIPDYLRSPTFWSLFFGGMIATAALTPMTMRLASWVGAMDSGGHRRIFQGSMPLLGGLAILLPFLAVCLMGLFPISEMFAYLRPQRDQFLVLGAGALTIGVLGVVDDVRGLRARYKFLVQTVVALIVVSTGETMESIYLPLVGELTVAAPVGVLLGVLWIVGLINAMNIIDGVDGLAAGIALIASFGLLVLGAIGQYTFAVLLCTALAGSLLGFLPYNFYPARIFLGDTGSMFLGFVLAAVSWIGTYKSETAVIVVAPLLALGFPIFETLVSMSRRMLRGRPIFSADDRHTHHRLLSQGYSQRKVVLLLYGVSMILTSVAIISRILPEGSPWEWVSVFVVVATLVGLGWLAGYLRTVPAEGVWRRRQRNAVLHALARYAALSLGWKTDDERLAAVLELSRMELGLRYLSVEPEGGSVHVSGEGAGGASGRRERLRVRSRSGGEVQVEYEFRGAADSEQRRDVAACLAQLFEEGTLGGTTRNT